MGKIWVGRQSQQVPPIYLYACKINACRQGAASEGSREEEMARVTLSDAASSLTVVDKAPQLHNDGETKRRKLTNDNDNKLTKVHPKSKWITIDGLDDGD